MEVEVDDDTRDEDELEGRIVALDLAVATATLRLGGVSYDLGRAVIKRDRCRGLRHRGRRVPRRRAAAGTAPGGR